MFCHKITFPLNSEFLQLQFLILKPIIWSKSEAFIVLSIIVTNCTTRFCPIEPIKRQQHIVKNKQAFRLSIIGWWPRQLYFLLVLNHDS